MSTMRKTVLVVDDDPDIHLFLGAYLEEAGYKRTSAYHGMTCAPMARHERPDLIVLDHGLPGQNGEDTLHTLQSDPELAQIPVLVVSAHGADVWETSMRSLGVCGYLRKPVDPLEFLKRVESVIGKAVRAPLPASDGAPHEPPACPHCGQGLEALSRETLEALLAQLD